MAGKLYPEDFEKVIFLSACGMSTAQIEKESGVSDSSVSGITRAFNAIKGKKWAMLEDLVTKSATNAYFISWASEKLNIPVPQRIFDLCNSMAEQRRAKARKEKEDPPEQVKLDLDTEQKNENQFFLNLIQQLQIQTSYLKSIQNGLAEIYKAMRDVKYIKENNDTNTNILCNTLEQIEKDIKDIVNELH